MKSAGHDARRLAGGRRVLALLVVAGCASVASATPDPWDFSEGLHLLRDQIVAGFVTNWGAIAGVCGFFVFINLVISILKAFNVKGPSGGETDGAVPTEDRWWPG